MLDLMPEPYPCDPTLWGTTPLIQSCCMCGWQRIVEEDDDESTMWKAGYKAGQHARYHAHQFVDYHNPTAAVLFAVEEWREAGVPATDDPAIPDPEPEPIEADCECW